MATSVVEVCNLALIHIGQRPIASITEATEGARKCNVVFTTARDAVLRLHPWNFATTVEALTEIADETILGWDYLYALPALCLFARRIDTEDTLDLLPLQEFEVIISPTSAVRAIATDLEGAYLRYTKQVADPTLWDPLFVTALSFYLAAILAVTLCGDKDLSARMTSAYMKSINEGLLANVIENKSNPTESSGLLDSR